jgi:polysaccharide export outer membrane protein
MTWKSWIYALGLSLVVAPWLGCMGTKPPAPYVCRADDIRAGDTLVISLLDILEPVKDQEFVVRTDGTINMLHLGTVMAAGKTFGQFEHDLQTAYVQRKIFRQVTVSVKPGIRFYSVGGEVKQPGRMQYSGETTVVRAVISCGDFTEFAKRTKVEILRANGDRETVDCNKAREDQKYDRPICPGDAVFVPRSL